MSAGLKTGFNKFNNSSHVLANDITVTLPSASWTADSEYSDQDANYKITVPAIGINADSTPIVGLVSEGVLATAEEIKAYSYINGWKCNSSSITFYASKIPEIDLNILLKGTIIEREETVIDNAMPEFTEAESRENIITGETVPTLFGKIKKWFADLKNVAFTGSYNDLDDKPVPETSLSVSEYGLFADAKNLSELNDSLENLNSNLDDVENYLNLCRFSGLQQLTNKTLYTAEYDGYLRCSIPPDSSPNNKTIVLRVNAEMVVQQNPSIYNTTIVSVFVKKGSTFMFELNNITITSGCWFFPLRKPMN